MKRKTKHKKTMARKTRKIKKAKRKAAKRELMPKPKGLTEQESEKEQKQKRQFDELEYIPKTVRVIENTRETNDSFTLKIAYKADSMPGQFLQIGILGLGEAPISICSYSEDYTELHVGQVGNVTNALAKMQKDELVTIRGPYGNGYPMEELKGKEIVLIGGGCGVAPLKSVIDYIAKKPADYKKLIIFLGYRTPEEIIFRKQLKEWRKKCSTNISADNNPKNSCFEGTIGFVTEMVKKAQLNEKETIAMICGPPLMIKNTIKVLNEKGIPDNQIYLSVERSMRCGIGICGHCMIRGKYTCKDGPVFRADQIKEEE